MYFKMYLIEQCGMYLIFAVVVHGHSDRNKSHAEPTKRNDSLSMAEYEVKVDRFDDFVKLYPTISNI